MRLTCVSQYQAVGCPWSGKLKDLASHTKKCPHKTTEAEKLDLLIKTESEKEKQASRLLENVIDYLKYENVDFYDLTLERTSRFSDGEIDADIMEFESEQFEAVGFCWKVHIEVTEAKSERPNICFYIRHCNTTSRNTFYNKVAFHLTNSHNTVWKITPKAWIHEFTQSSSTSPHYPLPISRDSDVNCVLNDEILYFRVFFFKH